MCQLHCGLGMEEHLVKNFLDIKLMKKNISEILNIDENLIGIKATTNERLGPEGREEGISCHSVVLLEKK